MWSREDVAAFLRWFEREFELPTIDLSKFCMNGKLNVFFCFFFVAEIFFLSFRFFGCCFL